MRWTKPYRLHITLRFLGECDQDEALSTLAAASLPAARVTLGPAPQRLGRGVVVLPAEGADELAAAVTEATRFIGDPLPDHPFVGHPHRRTIPPPPAVARLAAAR